MSVLQEDIIRWIMDAEDTTAVLPAAGLENAYV
jgi:hypothetical protein